MAEPDDSENLPTQTWTGAEEVPTIAATPPPQGFVEPPAVISSGRGGWDPPEPKDLQASFPQYEIRGILGRGGMGAVYQGWQKSLRRLVAIKILPPGLQDNGANFAERFQREAQAMARFSHPGIVAVYDAGETANGLFYFVMEYIEGTDVQKMVRSQGALSADYALAITASVCDALAYAHKRGVIHRDIKPSNIMVDAEGQVKVADFGLAKLANDDSAALVTGTNVSIGTPDFMAPEALYGIGQVDHRADIYAVGVMLYQMLTGEVPRGRFDLPSIQRPGVDPRFDAIVDRAMQRNPEKRYSSAVEIRADLDKILSASLPAAPPPAPPAPPPSAPRHESASAPTAPLPILPIRRKPGGIYAGVVAVVLVFIGGAIFLNRHRGGVPEASTAVGNPVILPAPDVARTPKPPTLQPPATDSSKQPEAAPVEATPAAYAAATIESPFVNTFGMQFVPVKITGGSTDGQRILVSTWETRVADFSVFANETKRKWPKPAFAQAPTHPAVNVSWDDATAYCQWLTERERQAGKISPTERYRLPSDHEWSCFVGIGDQENAAKSPMEKNKQIVGVYPWGRTWPPPAGAGNFSGEEALAHKTWDTQKILTGYRDNFPTTAPVGSFPANSLGLFDLSGNAWEWCADAWTPGSPEHTLRGASFSIASQALLLSSHRFHLMPSIQDDSTGFRCVLAADEPARITPARIPHPESGAELQKAAAKDRPFVNTLGMKFVSVPGTAVLFSIWETRVADYKKYSQARGRPWNPAPFAQTDLHPVVRVSWDEANEFCDWLTAQEHTSGALPATARYRLPTDLEWSRAVGLDEEYGETPQERDSVAPGFPWGYAWPPPKGCGNYDQSLHTDSFEFTSPAGSFSPNSYGIYDLGGNVLEWVEDFFSKGKTDRTVRGGSWADTAETIMSSSRSNFPPDVHNKSMGFRCVIAPVP